MIDLTDGIDSLTNFKRQTPAYLDRLRKTGQPLVLTVNGKAQVVVQDAASYQQLLELVERLEAVEKIQQGLDDVRNGRTRSLDKIIAEKKKKHGL